ncbi:YaeQ family protein [Arsukibacterium indicum]|uniref:YaeQ family protein n=1 Tax=Arsukibacterium indicum TaxID=2848612 RepID=A0ABS6MLQ8_9GAMM|nr:YaeQ family protein [Arsukibacterium indicum]MBV2129753.1 YaeQ family protein [Arsukibacterium indicum]
MMMNTKVVRLDLNYNCEALKLFQQHRHYIAPYQQESAEHFARRLLAYLILYDLHPTLNQHPGFGKLPDLYLRDDQQHFTLWAVVDPLPDKSLRRALHQADQVVLFLTEQQVRINDGQAANANADCYMFSDADIMALSLMLKTHMKLSVWREAEQLSLTDGTQVLDILLQRRIYH